MIYNVSARYILKRIVEAPGIHAVMEGRMTSSNIFSHAHVCVL